MIREFGLNKKLNIKAYKKYGLNYKKDIVVLNIKQKENFKAYFKTKIFGKFLKQKIKNGIDFNIYNKTFKGIKHKNIHTEKKINAKKIKIKKKEKKFN